MYSNCSVNGGNHFTIVIIINHHPSTCDSHLRKEIYLLGCFSPNYIYSECPAPTLQGRGYTLLPSYPLRNAAVVIHWHWWEGV